MQESILGKTAYPGNKGSEAECYTSVLRNTVRGKYHMFTKL